MGVEKFVIVHEISRALKSFEKQGDHLIYAPTARNSCQHKFFEKRFFYLQKVIPKAELQLNWQPQLSPEDKVYAWDAWNEKQVLYSKNLVPNAQNRLFDNLEFPASGSFTSFRKKVEPLLPLAFEEAIPPVDGDVQKKIQDYFYQSERPSSYFQTRNGMVSADDTSGFSPFLSCGALDVRFLYNQIRDYEKRIGANKSTYWLIFELLWREFFYWNYQYWNRAYFSFSGVGGPLNFESFTVPTITELRKMSLNEFWQAALTELEVTGFQFNRTRQLFASFWIYELGLHWRAGAQLFENFLIDYDVYSNWGNWMYIAGVGADPQGGRKFSISSQLERYDPGGEYLKTWLKGTESESDL